MICSIPGCGQKVHGYGWCGKHYWCWKKNGDPLARQRAPGEAKRYLREVVLAYEGDECLIWPFARLRGYAMWRGKIVSRIACEEHNGPPPTPKHEAAHSCGNGAKGCVTKRHTSWKTRTENEADKVIHGTRLRGERCGWAKLTAAQVHKIRALKGTMLQREIADQFSVSRQTINEIHTGKKWAWL
jgi:hypothetical protein